jgi:hypothetical protein
MAKLQQVTGGVDLAYLNAGVTTGESDMCSLAALCAAHFPTIRPEEIAAAVLAIMVGDEAGLPSVCQAGREPVAYHHRRVPGPGGEDSKGILPPPEFAGHDQLGR